MYLQNLKLWNFRKYGNPSGTLDLDHSALNLTFHQGINVLIGENDSGKTAIIDAIKLALKTHANEWIKVDDDDFYQNSNELRIELIIAGFTSQEASHFTEWLSWDGTNSYLHLVLQAKRDGLRITTTDLRAGSEPDGKQMSSEAKEYLKVTYLRPLRNADNDLTAKKSSRLSQILEGHPKFHVKNGEKHKFQEIIEGANKQIEDWFSVTDGGEHGIKGVIDGYVQDFIDNNDQSMLSISDPDIKGILERISLTIADAKNLGLGTMNRLYMAAELLFLKEVIKGSLNLCLIEELEAHLHPQAQMKIIESLSRQEGVQFILTSHSPNLASKLPLESLIVCKGDNVYPLRKGETLLDNRDYAFLEHFLDVTKTNLFFAKGIILVEGWAEEILIPVIAKKMGCDLTKKEVSIINVGSTAFLRFAKIFTRKSPDQDMQIPVSLVTDLDCRPKLQTNGNALDLNEDGSVQFDSEQETNARNSKKQNFKEIETDNIKAHISDDWTLEWCLYESSLLKGKFEAAVHSVHSDTAEFKVDDSDFSDISFGVRLAGMLGGDPKATRTRLSKVQVASELARLMQEDLNLKIDPTQNYPHIQYLIDAILHACND